MLECCCAGDEEARNRGTQKSVLERKAPPTFPLLIEMRERAFWVTHWVEDSVDCLLHGKAPVVQVSCLPDIAICWLVDCLQGCTVSSCELKGCLHIWALHPVTAVCVSPL